MTEKKYLPIGTVCKLKNAKRNLMIIGFAVKKQAGDDADKVYDYLACIYPIGLFDQNQNFMFNHDDIEEIPSLFGDGEKIITHCKGCETDDIRRHNGIYCKIMDWETGKHIKFIDLIKK